MDGLALRKALSRTPLRPYLTALRCSWLLEREYGHFRSSRLWSAVDRHGAPIPWYSYPVIEFLRQLDLSDKEVFEYGAGNSTLFWAHRARRVVGVEDDGPWFEKIAPQVPSNVELSLVRDKDAYVNAVSSTVAHDVIVIDGSHRGMCARAAVPHLRAGGMIVLDNADWYVRTAAHLRSAGLIQIDFTGFTPINAYTATTSLFLHRDFSTAPIGRDQPVHGVGSLRQYAADDL